MVLPEVTVFGCRFLPVAVLDVAVHEERSGTAMVPELDGDVLAMWEGPSLRGLLERARRLSGGLFGCAAAVPVGGEPGSGAAAGRGVDRAALGEQFGRAGFRE